MELHPKRSLFGLRSFRFEVGPTGVDVHTGFLKRQLAWSEITQITLEQVGSGFALFATLATRGTEQVRLVDLSAVRESPDEVASALAAAAGGRFADLRGRPTPNAVVRRTAFTVVLRGFDLATVDKLLSECELAMAEDDVDRARDAVEWYRSTPPEVALRGYDRAQVDMYFAEVAGWIDAGR